MQDRNMIMNMKRAFIVLLFFTAGLLARLSAESAEASGKAESDVKIKKLEAEKKNLALEMHRLRVSLIKSDPEIRELHKKIMAMHKELAFKIDAKPEMKELLAKARRVENMLLRLRSGKDSAK